MSNRLPFQDRRVIRPPILSTAEIPTTQFDRQIDPPLGTGGGGGAATDFIPPFCLEQVNDTNVKVKFAQVNGITPTGIATNIDVSGTDGTWSIYLDCTLDATGAVTAATVSSGTTGVPSNTYDHAYILIGETDVVDALITAVRYSLLFSQGFVACGRDPDAPETTPGTFSFYVA